MNIMIYQNLRYAATLLCAGAVLTNYQAFAQTPGTVAQMDDSPSYAALADLALDAPIVAQVRIKRAINVPAERAPNLAAGYARLYLEADIVKLIRGRGGLNESIRYLADVPLDARGRTPKYKKRDFLIFANSAPGRPGEVQLLGSDAQLAWTPEIDLRTRMLLREIVSPSAPPQITGVREALHVPGNLEGEGETQIFLRTADNAPAAISVLRRPGLRPQWAVSLSEIVDEAASAPQRETLLWYRLACFLPPVLPRESLLSDNARANDLAQADYRFVKEQLGPCTR